MPDPQSSESDADAHKRDMTVEISPPISRDDIMETSIPLANRSMPALEEGPTVGMVGGYKLLEKLGEGGMGTVYLAEDVSLRRRVALKVMKKHVADEPVSRERFFREARAAAKLEHDNIVAIHQVGEDRGIPYLAMPLLKGESLGTILKKRGRPALAFILKISRDVASGLAAAHGLGLIHRDIKPDNIWVETLETDESTQTIRGKILDFGLARPQQEAESMLTHEGAVLGTPAYMAPEQARGIAVDQRADLFSLGCVMYEMSTGRRPFTGPDTMAILTSLIVDQPPDPRSLNGQIPVALSRLITQLLEKDPARRPASAREVADVLRKLAADPNTPSTFTFTTAPSLASASVPSISIPSNSSLTGSNPSNMYTGQLAPWAEEPRGWNFPWVTVILICLAGFGVFVFYKLAPLANSSGTLSIEVADEADSRYRNAELRVFEGGNLIKTLKPHELKLNLKNGTYIAKLSGADDLRLEVTVDLLPKKGKDVEFKIEGDKKTILRVTALGGSDKKKDGKDTKEKPDDGPKFD